MIRTYCQQWVNKDLPILQILDPRLNMFLEDGVDLYAILGCDLPYGSFKLLAALALLNDALDSGIFKNGDAVIEATSGRTGLALARVILQNYPQSSVTLVMKPDVPRAKSEGPRIAGATIIPPLSGLTPIETARFIGGSWKDQHWRQSKEQLNLDQYANPTIVHLYSCWAAPKIRQELRDLNLFFCPMGTAGTALGLFHGFQNVYKKMPAFYGVICEDGQEIPGMRDEKGMREILHPWNTTPGLNIVKESRSNAFLSAPWLGWGPGVPAGPSAGATYAACCKKIDSLKKSKRLDSVRGGDGRIRAAFVVHDDIVPYVGDRFTTEFSLENFHPSTAKEPSRLFFNEAA